MNAARRSAITIADLRMDMVARIAGGAALFILAAAFAISFFAIKWVADEMGIEPWFLAWLFPLVIDLPSLIASALTVALHDRPFRVRFYAWSVLGVFIVLSWACNAVHALSIVAEGNNRFVVLLGELSGSKTNAPWLIALVLVFAAIPPVGVVLGVHLWAYSLRHAMSADRSAVDGAIVRSKAAPKPERKGLFAMVAAMLVRAEPEPEGKPTDQKPTDENTSAPGQQQKKTAPPPPAEVPEAEETAPDTVRAEFDPEVAMRAQFDQAIAAAIEAGQPLVDPKDKPDASKLHELAGVGDVKSKATTRRWVQKWWDEHAEKLRAQDVRDEIHAADPPGRHTAEIDADERERERVGAA